MKRGRKGPLGLIHEMSRSSDAATRQLHPWSMHLKAWQACAGRSGPMSVQGTMAANLMERFCTSGRDSCIQRFLFESTSGPVSLPVPTQQHRLAAVSAVLAWPFCRGGGVVSEDLSTNACHVTVCARLVCHLAASKAAAGGAHGGRRCQEGGSQPGAAPPPPPPPPSPPPPPQEGAERADRQQRASCRHRCGGRCQRRAPDHGAALALDRPQHAAPGRHQEEGGRAGEPSERGGGGDWQRGRRRWGGAGHARREPYDGGGSMTSQSIGPRAGPAPCGRWRLCRPFEASVHASGLPWAGPWIRLRRPRVLGLVGEPS